jgi:hypothetical protein
VESGTPKPLHAVWGGRRDDVWAVGETTGGLTGVNGIVLHWNGAAWSQVSCGKTPDLHTTWGTAPNDVWAGGAGSGVGGVVHWDGTRWSAPFTTDHAISKIWGSGREVWMVDGTDLPRQWDAATLSKAAYGGNRTVSVWGAAPGDVRAAGDGGRIVHWNGADWRVVASGTTQALTDLWGSGPDDVWAVGAGGTLLHWNGVGWSRGEEGTTNDLMGVWGSGPDDVWAVGAAQTIVHWNGASWTTGQLSDAGSPYWVWSVWGSGPDDVWAAGKETLSHWDGRAWTSVDMTGLLFGLSGTGPNDVWVTGGWTRHWDGQTWTSFEDVAGTAVWARTANDAWIVGASGHTAHWDGTSWTAKDEFEYAVDLAAVWGAGANQVWAVGRSKISGYGVIVRWDGATWSREPIASLGTMTGIWGRGPDDVWAVGQSAIFHWDGTAWSESAQASGSAGLRAVWVSPDGHVWAVGDTGTVLRR